MTIQLTQILNSEARLAELHLMLDQAANASNSVPDLNAQLLTALDDPYLAIRTLAASALSTETSPEITQNLAERAADPHTSTRSRSAACLALKTSHDPKIAALLLQNARATQPDLRYHALLALADSPVVNEHDLVELVAERLQDTDHGIITLAAQIAAARRFGELLPAVTKARQTVSKYTRLPISLALAELLANTPSTQDLTAPNDLIQELITALKDERTLANAAKALAELNATQATDALIKTLDRRMTHPILRVAIASTLTELGHPRGPDFLSQSLQSRRKDARGYAIRQIARLNLTQHLPHIIQLAHSNDYHADTALLALHDFNTPETLTQIHLIATQHPDPEQRELAHELTQHLTLTP